MTNRAVWRCSSALCLVAALAASAAARLAAQTPRVGPPNGTLVIVGGAMQSEEIYRRFIELAGGRNAPIVLIPTAAGDDEYDDSYAGLGAWREHGARNLTVLHTTDPTTANSEEFVEPLTKAKAVFFFGGRQWRIVEAYAGTRTEVELRNVLERGGVIGGTSAGASVLGSFLVRGDTETNEVIIGDHQVGFGYLRDVAIDQHVLRRNRHFDMLELLEVHPELLGIGLDEDTAIIVRGDRFEVIGASYALIYDRRTTTGREGTFYFLAPGDGFDLGTRRATRPARTQGTVPNLDRRPW
ncbi:MAG: cyanophycinase [Gemmatimonadetes bacterium]|nr:cyanophycinase [Gemmatimonadota bacterium]